MSQYSAQIFICFIAYIFLFLYSSVGLVGNFAGLPLCTVSSAIVHCYRNEVGHQTIKAPSMPCWGAAAHKNTPWNLCHRTGEIDRWNGWNLYQWEVFSARAKWMDRFFAYLWVILLYFDPESRLISGVLELCQVRLYWKLIRSII